MVTNPDRDALKGMLQTMEHMLNTLDAASVAARQLIDAQRAGKPLSPKTLDHYAREFEALKEKRVVFRDVIARWWTLADERPQ